VTSVPDHRSGGNRRRSDHDHHHHHAGDVRAQAVVLDLGKDIGALVVYTDPELVGVEIEISPAGDDAGRSHKQVLLRSTGGSTVAALVYDNLREGEYTLWHDGVAKDRNVRVRGGAVAELDWRAADAG
jgi:hypothetical protein